MIKKLRRVVDYLSSISELRNTQIDKTNPLEEVLSKKEKALISRQKYFSDVYNVLSQQYTDPMDSNYLNLDGVLLLKPTKEHQLTFTLEVIDILGLHLIQNEPLLKACWRTSEGAYENENVKVNSGDTVIDCGANMGIFSTLSASKGANVFAFEPVASIIQQYLKPNAKNYPNIQIVEKALAENNGKLQLSVDLDNIGGTSGVFQRKSGKSLFVDTTSIDSFVSDNQIEKIDFIKCDIEGMEREMLKGASNVLREFAPKLAICKYHFKDDPQVLRGIILSANPNYTIKETRCKMLGHVK